MNQAIIRCRMCKASRVLKDMPACNVGSCQRTSTTSTVTKGEGGDSSWRCPCAARALCSVRMVEGTYPQPPSEALRKTLGPHIKLSRTRFHWAHTN